MLGLNFVICTGILMQILDFNSYNVIPTWITVFSTTSNYVLSINFIVDTTIIREIIELENLLILFWNK